MLTAESTKRAAASNPVVNRAGWSIKDFTASVGISVAKFYILSADQKPRTVKLHGRVIVIESPDAYLSRMAELQGA